MPQAGVLVFASLTLLVILPSVPTCTLARSHRSTSHNDKHGGSAYNECRTSSCQIAYLNSVEDFCLWAPSYPGSDLSVTRDTEHTLTAWCIKDTHGTRPILDGTISCARFIKTPEYVQITGVGNLTNINAPADGVASASGESDRRPGIVFTGAYGQLEQIDDWTSFVSQERFCFRACNPSAATCPPIHDVFGCAENVPAHHGTGLFEDCVGDAIEAPSTLYQGVLAAPSHHSAFSHSGCTTRGTIGNARVARARRAISSISFSTPSAPVTSYSWSDGQSPSMATTSTSGTTTITFPPPPTPTLNVTIPMNSTIPVSLPTPTSMTYSFNHTYTHWHSHSHNHSRHHFSTLPTPLSSSYPSFSPSSTGFSLSDPSSTPSPTSFTSTFSTFSSSNLSSSGTATSYITSTPAFTTPVSTPTPTSMSMSMSSSSFPSSYGMSSSLSESPQPSSYSSSPPPASPTSSTAPPSISPSTSSQSSVILTFTTSLSPSFVPSTSPSTSSALPNSATQVGTQCPPPSRRAVNAGSITPSTPLLSLICTLLMIVISSSIGVFIV